MARSQSSAALGKQRIGSAAVRGGGVTVGGDPGDFRLEHGNPFAQFGLRIGRKILRREATRGISGGPWAVWFFHHTTASPAK